MCKQLILLMHLQDTRYA